MSDPDQITSHTLHDGDVAVTMLSLGCITQDWRLAVGGRELPMVLGYRDPQAYRTHKAYLGAIVGPVANRIAGARFVLEAMEYRLTANDGPHLLHGGAAGLGTRNWRMDPDGTRAVRLRHTSAEAESGFPGTVEFEVIVTLTGHTLRYDMRARPDRPSPVNLAQHNYYTLGMPGEIRDLRLMLHADGITPAGADLIPTGEIRPLDGLPWDFRAPRTIAQADPDRAGLDLNYVLRPGAGPAAQVWANNGLTLDLRTDQPGMQVYTATHLSQLAAPLEGQKHAAFHGLCLEPQGFPNAVNTPAFPTIIATPDMPYRQVTDVTIRPGTGPEV